MRRLPITAVALSALLAGPTRAHEKWANGDPLPAWVKADCCGSSDAHIYDLSQVHETEQGYRLDGYPDVIERQRALPSQDGHAWAFFRTNADGSFTRVYCLFVPMSF